MSLAIFIAWDICDIIGPGVQTAGQIENPFKTLLFQKCDQFGAGMVRRL
ncbi:hypothetical protein KF707_10975 [Candidatus Obscuribacterales bacterium]|nr:hypothetical protein [Candidatus Obscuribacterales bacterium]